MTTIAIVSLGDPFDVVEMFQGVLRDRGLSDSVTSMRTDSGFRSKSRPDMKVIYDPVRDIPGTGFARYAELTVVGTAYQSDQLETIATLYYLTDNYYEEFSYGVYTEGELRGAKEYVSDYANSNFPAESGDGDRVS